MSRWQTVAASFVELADTVADDFDPYDFLQKVAARAAAVSDAPVAMLLLEDHRGHLQLAATTDDRVETLAIVHHADGAGPFADAARLAVPVVNVPPDEAASRWPAFTAAARAAGLTSTHVVPMRVRTRVLGALGVLFADDVPLDDDGLAILQALASVATIGLLQERTLRQREVMAEQVHSALDVRIRVEQAKGVVAESLGLRVDAAYDLLTRQALETGVTVSQLAVAVLEGTLDPRALVQDGTSPADSR